MQTEETTTTEEKLETFFPSFLFKEAVAALIVFIGIVALAVFIPMAMGDPADPSASAFKPRPEWYFMSAFYLLKLCPSSLEVVPTILGPTLGGLFLILMPFIDKHPERSPKKRPVAMILTAVIAVSIIGLTVAGIYLD
jgi:quinol-cytochrome oxidoreductase complex cytochrome b subunit